eukprot:5121525-Karenia_brevis.AAC.1
MMWCARMQAENKFVKAAKYAVSQYEELIKTQKEAEGIDVLKEKLGVPAVHCWNALVQEMLKDPQGTMTAMQAEAVKTLMKDWSWKAVLDSVPHCKIAKMFGQEHKRVEIASPADHGVLEVLDVEPEKATPLMLTKLLKARLLKESGARMLRGAAPKGDLERKLQ